MTTGPVMASPCPAISVMCWWAKTGSTSDRKSLPARGAQRRNLFTAKTWSSMTPFLKQLASNYDQLFTTLARLEKEPLGSRSSYASLADYYKSLGPAGYRSFPHAKKKQTIN